MTTSLRPFADADLDPLFAWQADPAAVWMAAFTAEDPTDRAAFDAHYRMVRANPEGVLRAIDHDGGVAGMIASFVVDGDVELTYWVDPARWGRGIATDAVRLFLDVETRRPLCARVAEGNVGSRRVLERSGFVVVGEDVGFAPGRGGPTREVVLRLA